jgi:hypothetical protein
MQYTTIINWDGETASTDENLGLLRKILYQTSPATSTEHHEIKTGLIILK